MTNSSPHTLCVDDIERLATERCQALGLRSTTQRLEVLKALAQDHRAHGAYDIITMIERAGGGKLAPTAVYRALEFWRDAGLVHKIGGLDRFCVCFNARDHHSHLVVCCDQCFTVKEWCDHRAGFDLSQALNSLGFANASTSQIEVIARCDQCI